MPHGYTNATSTDGRRVVKRYLGPDAAERQSAETLALTRLAGRLPMPRLLAQTGGRIELGWIAGVPGQERLETHPEQVLYVAGETARMLLGIAVDSVPGLPHRAGGEVLVHGDFGPQNLLLDSDTGQPTAIVDWEFAHIGDRLTDIAWAEWILRTHHPHLLGALPSLYAGYQERPGWPERQAAMLARCAELLNFVRRWSAPDDAAVRQWQRRTAATAAFRE